MRWRLLAFAAAVLAAASCTDRKLPTAATPIAGPAPPVAAPPLPTTVPGVLSIAMPIDSGDLASAAFGMTPFGYHGGDHAPQGHAGWDIEYRIGAAVRAAAAGTVLTVAPDVSGRSIVELEHVVGTHFYRTVYTNLQSVPDDLVTGAAVRAGQPLGVAGTQSQFVSRIPIVYAMSHFQLDDLEFHREGPDPKAVSPEPFLNAAGRSLFDRIWSTATFGPELVEPFATNPRTLPFPASRTWTKAGGDGLAGFRFTRATPGGTEYEYAVLAESGTTVEIGTARLVITSRPTTIDLVSATATRLGIYDIVSGEMRLALGNPGEARPTGFGAASTYRSPQ